MQNTSHLLMIEPADFGFNAETAVNNAFQKNNEAGVQQEALKEFRDLVNLLQQNKIDVTVVKDSGEDHTPDSIFPNNWVSFHENGNVFLYPMFAANRRLERKHLILNALKQKFVFNETIDLTYYEELGYYLEGTGSMVLDRVNHLAYACISPRTTVELLNSFCIINQFDCVSFSAKDETGVDIYHTNVMMSVADRYAVICLEAINDQTARENVITTLERTGKAIIEISLEQLRCFAGNMLQVINADKELLLVMSTQAYQSLGGSQLATLLQYNRILHSPLNHIESVGGGSARCMMAEIFLTPK